MTSTFVLVHGSFSNSFSWAPLARELTLRGHRALAVDLPGHGFQAGWHAAYQAPQDPAGLATAPSPLATIPYADTVDHVIDVLRRVNGPVVLVGHSRGGLALTGVANKAPELVSRLVYMSAWCCVNLTAAEYNGEPENATSALNTLMDLGLADPAAIGAIRLNWRTADPALITALHGALLADGTERELLAYLNTLEPDESLDAGGPDDRAHADTWGRVPRSYVRLTGDRSMPLALQDRFIAEADALTPDNPFDVHSLDSSHCGIFVHPEAAADLLSTLA